MQNLQNEMQSVHSDAHAPQFDFSVNGNYTDLEKASEQFIDVANQMGKQKNQPKVIKITKTVAVKVPVVKYVKVPVPMKPEEAEHSVPMSSNAYSHHYPIVPTSVTPHKPEKYIPRPHPQPTKASPSYENSVFDTKPFYGRDPNDPNVMIKYIPVPVYSKAPSSSSQREHISAAYSHGSQQESSEQNQNEDHEHHHDHTSYEHHQSQSPQESSSNYHQENTAYEYQYPTSSSSNYYKYHSADSVPHTSTASHVYHPHPQSPSKSVYHQPEYRPSHHEPQVRYVYQ